MKTHGGPHKVLVDKTAVLEGVEFLLYQASEEQRIRSADLDLKLFWRELFKFTRSSLGATFGERRPGSACSGDV